MLSGSARNEDYDACDFVVSFYSLHVVRVGAGVQAERAGQRRAFFEVMLLLCLESSMSFSGIITRSQLVKLCDVVNSVLLVRERMVVDG